MAFRAVQTDAVATKHAATGAERTDRSGRSKHPNMSRNSLTELSGVGAESADNFFFGTCLPIRMIPS